MRAISLVAINVFRESVRDKVLYNLVAFAVLLIAASFLLGQLTGGQDIKIIKDLGLAAISLFGVLIAVFIGIGLVWKEVEKRSIYSVLSKPVTRHQFVLGKYCGLLLTLLVNVAVMTVALLRGARLHAVGGRAGDARRWRRCPPWIRRCSRRSCSSWSSSRSSRRLRSFFSTFSSPFLSAILTLGLWVIGSLSADFKNFETLVDSPVAGWVGRGVVLRPAELRCVRRQDAGRRGNAGRLLVRGALTRSTA